MTKRFLFLVRRPLEGVVGGRGQRGHARADLQQSIAEADTFLAEMEREQQAAGKTAS